LSFLRERHEKRCSASAAVRRKVKLKEKSQQLEELIDSAKKGMEEKKKLIDLTQESKDKGQKLVDLLEKSTVTKLQLTKQRLSQSHLTSKEKEAKKTPMLSEPSSSNQHLQNEKKTEPITLTKKKRLFHYSY